ncbi:hypothetical protein AN963_14715 [Brevibacillus choshinensis]|uniref:Uncharacterized protein n=1 Tax=Brevibacillus choshinensis TaxID=54911 RepID=A0ABR5N6J2_BRECH|nr:permease prefix domain 1-containing protein [Brevibacillus choshinensis]KQL46221.1 hypothetical protein AN963_14715 [Brevibacillus choshinensis]
MDRLHQHVEQLFRPYRGMKQAQELKQEVMSNLEARVADMTTDGMDRAEAVRLAIANIPSIAHLIAGNHRIYVYRFWVEWVQRVLLYSLVAWIVTMPLRMVGDGTGLNTAILVVSLFVGIVYVVLLLLRRTSVTNKEMNMNVRAAFRLRKIGWILWSIFIAVSLLFTTALHFASNFWFSRPISISGPYQFAMVAIAYFKPFVSILIPLALHLAPKLLMKYEVGEEDGCKE